MQMTVTQMIKAAAAIITMTTNTANKYNKIIHVIGPNCIILILTAITAFKIFLGYHTSVVV